MCGRHGKSVRQDCPTRIDKLFRGSDLLERSMDFVDRFTKSPSTTKQDNDPPKQYAAQNH